MVFDIGGNNARQIAYVVYRKKRIYIRHILTHKEYGNGAEYFKGKKVATKIIYASQTDARLDSNVLTGGGTDDTRALQKVLDLSLEYGGIHLVVDGAALTTGLIVHSNTTIECLNKACGFYLADHSNRPLIINANPSAQEIIDRNITLSGGTYNHNCLHQAHHLPEDVHYSQADSFVVAISFFGVENLLVRDVTIRNQRTFAFLITNWQKVTMENICLELPDFIHGGNQDGIHVQGPGRFLILKNIQGSTGDDFIAINADEEFLGEKNFFHPCASIGPVTDVVVDTVMVNDAAQILRVLSRESIVDRVFVKNVSGNYRSFGFYLSAWDYLSKGYPGNFGALLFENINVRQTKADYTYTEPFLFRISGHHRSLMLKNIHYLDPADDRYLVYVEGESDIKDIGTTPAEIDSLLIDGLHINDTTKTPQSRPYLVVKGHVRHMIVRNAEVLNREPKKAVFLATNGEYAKIDQLFLYNMALENIGLLIDDHEKKITNCHSTNIFGVNS